MHFLAKLFPTNSERENAKGNIAVCPNTTDNFFSKDLSIFSIAKTATVMTPSLGIERIILNIISNPNVRHLKKKSF
jgi:tetrahydromethanopterin S-methyltransferase subunit A